MMPDLKMEMPILALAGLNMIGFLILFYIKTFGSEELQEMMKKQLVPTYENIVSGRFGSVFFSLIGNGGNVGNFLAANFFYFLCASTLYKGFGRMLGWWFWVEVLRAFEFCDLY